MKRLVTAAIVASALLCGPLMAADLNANRAPDDVPAIEERWTYSITPYFWAAGLSGETAQFGLPTVNMDASFSDIFDNLDFGGMLMGEARNGRFSVFGDLIYTKLSADDNTPHGSLATSVDVDTQTFAGLFGVGYSVLEGPEGRLDVVGGLRVWSVETEISFNGGILGGRSYTDSATWVDGLAGVRGTYNFTPNFYAIGWGLVGGGGANIDWDVMAGVGYNINETVSATIGYRALGVDYRDNGFIFDVVQQGPIVGFTIRF
ncbi:hypothetical protein IB265_32675 [Ensifer sp. ENS10]|uniref:hypothetical protein n=1 Tax=Ensifer sp. ENS10 TaxID=2769286 RepID=UPI00177E1007|nr:hypothetical protein [Ensifer sp. ENS10]MBD9511512.1 hypothetical protein [Ensifer sp. ENS10]